MAPRSPRLPAVNGGAQGLALRVDDLALELEEHKEEDTRRFEELRGDIAKVGPHVGTLLEAMRLSLQGQITELVLAKARAEGEAEGIAKATAPKPLTTSQIVVRSLLGTFGVVAMSAVIGLISWMGSTIWQLEQEKITQLQGRPTVTVAPTLPVYVPQQSAQPPTGEPKTTPTPN